MGSASLAGEGNAPLLSLVCAGLVPAGAEPDTGLVAMTPAQFLAFIESVRSGDA